MKKAILLLLLVFSGICTSQSVKDLHGKWVGVDQGAKGYVTFFPDGFISFNFGDTDIDGKNFTIPDGEYKGKTGQIKYSIDFSQRPYKISVIILLNNDGEIVEGEFMRGLIDFNKKDEILFFADPEHKNPEKIDPLSPDTMLFHRISSL